MQGTHVAAPINVAWEQVVILSVSPSTVVKNSFKRLRFKRLVSSQNSIEIIVIELLPIMVEYSLNKQNKKREY